MLDWTRSPYVASFFAFNTFSSEVERVSIYVYLERPYNYKVGSSSEPYIHVFGPYVKTHKRHFLQQSQYTICFKWIDGERYYQCHEDVLSADNTDQDILWKFTIPITERVKVLRRLFDYNITPYSLFATEDALIETLKIKELFLKDT